ncbi:hypothetical protein GlitD10_0452 [Gloeomargarita lithophora Alchichica-D10]|uniref:Min27-like integrase DNA-binding domain-containing protein n=1 Tax=Gloeomargarita lithophora Alchichica-D10 TaxID=1188229 RepID=A0A1J0AA10_9CYAN|nr:hypothetical protein GlitD10_0452 [Gloeomargarita lithophora Alchichica-D10]
MKAPAGTVKAFNNNGRITLRWTYQGKRYALSVGLKFMPNNLKAVAGTIAQIERDISYWDFERNWLLNGLRPRHSNCFTSISIFS